MSTSTAVQAATGGVPDLAGQPDRVGQATAIEQSRAVAEVQAAIVVAQQCPRSINAAVTAMRESCSQQALAERAFYRFPRGGQTVTGPSVHLARELARCWGNVQYGIAELRRDDEQGQSEMQAYAWDVQTNTRSVQVFVVPHKRDTRKGPTPLIDMRDVYENNANNGARRLREAIFAILPPWFVEEAKDLCSKALSEGGGKPLAQRIADSVKAFERQFGVTVDQLEQKLGRDRDRWTEHDIAQLTVTYRSLDRREITVEDEFPPQRTTVDEIKGQAEEAKPAKKAATRRKAPEKGEQETLTPEAPDGASFKARMVAFAERAGRDSSAYQELYEAVQDAGVVNPGSAQSWEEIEDPAPLVALLDEAEAALDGDG